MSRRQGGFTTASRYPIRRLPGMSKKTGDPIPQRCAGATVRGRNKERFLLRSRNRQPIARFGYGFGWSCRCRRNGRRDRHGLLVVGEILSRRVARNGVAVVVRVLVGVLTAGDSGDPDESRDQTATEIAAGRLRLRSHDLDFLEELPTLRGGTAFGTLRPNAGQIGIRQVAAAAIARKSRGAGWLFAQGSAWRWIAIPASCEASNRGTGGSGGMFLLRALTLSARSLDAAPSGVVDPHRGPCEQRGYEETSSRRSGGAAVRSRDWRKFFRRMCAASMSRRLSRPFLLSSAERRYSSAMADE